LIDFKDEDEFLDGGGEWLQIKLQGYFLYSKMAIFDKIYGILPNPPKVVHT
jgi:hypothetical protein